MSPAVLVVVAHVGLALAAADAAPAPVAALDVAAPPEAATPSRQLTLEQALATATAHQPQLAQAHANTEASRARADGAFAPILPQLTTSASYGRGTANQITRGGSTTSFQITGLPAGVKIPTISTVTPKPTNDSYDAWNLGANANVVVFDFGRSLTAWTAARTAAEGKAYDEKNTASQVAFTVRSSFYAARAQYALVAVAQEALQNQDRHLTQVAAYVEVGRRPQIDLAQVKGERANAYVQLVNAENAYAGARARLFQAMGVPGDDGAVIADEPFVAVAGEDANLDVLIDEARGARPDVAGLERQIHAEQLSLASTMAGYAPVLAVGAGVTDAGTALDALTWNWNAQATLSWTLFSGGSTFAQQREAGANLDGLRAAAEELRQQLRFDVEQAQLGVRAAKASLAAAEDAVTAASERFRLAEGRYEEGQGSALELGDAQLALTSAEAQRVQADFNLASARAGLVRALGR